MPSAPPSDTPHILLVNPWIHDFAAYDFWAKPLGLLLIAAVLRNAGYRVSYVNCLDRFHPRAAATDPSARFGRGPYRKKRIANPPGLAHIRRTFSRYGIEPQWLAADVSALGKVDAILVTSLMTYWYPGVCETIEVLRQAVPGAPILLGGVYATLCPDHARAVTGADRVVTGASFERVVSLLSEMTGWRAHSGVKDAAMDTWPSPALDLEHVLSFVPLLTTVGCPFSCAYCASRFLAPSMQRRSVGSVMEEIRLWHGRHGVRDFVFYDDALLVDPDTHAIPLLEDLIREGMPVRFHTPNAVHIREITDRTARLLKRAGFETLRLGLETTAFASRKGMDAKVTAAEFHRAADCLLRAGFSKKNVGAYLLAGLPGQSYEGVAASIQAVHAAGIQPILAYYTPIPHTALWPGACAASPYDLAADPVFTNNAIMPCRFEGFDWEVISRLKGLAASGP